MNQYQKFYSEYSIVDIFNMLWKGKYFILAITFLASVTAYLLSNHQTDFYEGKQHITTLAASQAQSVRILNDRFYLGDSYVKIYSSKHGTDILDESEKKIIRESMRDSGIIFFKTPIEYFSAPYFFHVLKDVVFIQGGISKISTEVIKRYKVTEKNFNKEIERKILDTTYNLRPVITQEPYGLSRPEIVFHITSTDPNFLESYQNKLVYVLNALVKKSVKEFVYRDIAYYKDIYQDRMYKTLVTLREIQIQKKKFNIDKLASKIKNLRAELELAEKLSYEKPINFLTVRTDFTLGSTILQKKIEIVSNEYELLNADYQKFIKQKDIDIDVMMKDLDILFEYFESKFDELFINEEFFVFDYDELKFGYSLNANIELRRNVSIAFILSLILTSIAVVLYQAINRSKNTN